MKSEGLKRSLVLHDMPLGRTRPTSACSRPPTAPRSKYPGACAAPFGEVHLPLVSSGQRCSGEVVAPRLLRNRAQDAGG